MRNLLFGIPVFLLFILLGFAAVDWYRGSGDRSSEAMKAVVPPANVIPQKLFEITVNGKRGCMNIEGKVIIAPAFDHIWCSDQPLLLVTKDKRYGYVDQLGNRVIEPLLEDAGEFREGAAYVKVGDKYGFIDAEGKFKIEPRLDRAGNFYEGFAIVSAGGMEIFGLKIKVPEAGFIDSTGTPAFADKKFSGLEPFHEGRAMVILNGQAGLMDRSGKFTPGLEPLLTGKFSEGLATRWEGYRAGYVDENGKLVIDIQFKQAGEFHEGLAPVMFENGKYGYINKTGEIIIAAQFDTASDFQNGLALVRIDRKTGFINHRGEIAIPLIFGGADGFVDGLASITFQDGNVPYDETKWGYIDGTGKIVWEPTN